MKKSIDHQSSNIASGLAGQKCQHPLYQLGLAIFMLCVCLPRPLAAQTAPLPNDEFQRICSQGNLAEVKDLWQRLEAGEDIYGGSVYVDGARKACLGFAGLNPDLDVLKFLLGAGLDPNAFFDPKTPEFRSGHTPLIMAARGNPNPQAAQMLIDAGADVNKYGEYEDLPPLLAASQYNPNPDMIRTLLAAGADLKAVYDPRDYPKPMAITLAAQHNPNPLVAGALLEAGADIEYVSRSVFDGVPPLALAAKHNPNPQMFLFLLAKGADVTKAGGKGALIVLAAQNPNPEVLAETLKLSDETEGNQQQALAEALHKSIYHCRPAGAALLLKNGAPINDQTRLEIGRTALLLMMALSPDKSMDKVNDEGRLKDCLTEAAAHLGRNYGPEIEAVVNDFKPQIKTYKGKPFVDFDLTLTSQDGRLKLQYTTRRHPDSGIQFLKPNEKYFGSYKCNVGIFMGKTDYLGYPKDVKPDLSKLFVQ